MNSEYDAIRGRPMETLTGRTILSLAEPGDALVVDVSKQVGAATLGDVYNVPASEIDGVDGMLVQLAGAFDPPMPGEFVRLSLIEKTFTGEGGRLFFSNVHQDAMPISVFSTVDTLAQEQPQGERIEITGPSYVRLAYSFQEGGQTRFHCVYLFVTHPDKTQIAEGEVWDPRDWHIVRVDAPRDPLRTAERDELKPGSSS